MPLNAEELILNMKGTQSKFPETLEEAASNWALSVYSYATKSNAGPTLPLFSFFSLKEFFLSSLAKNSFVSDLGNNLNLWLNFSTWSSPSPGFVGYAVPGEILDSKKMELVIMSGEIDKIDEYYASKIHLWIISRKILVTNINTGSTYLYNIS